MKRILPFLLAVPLAAYAFACSSDDDADNNNNNNSGGDTDGGGNNNNGNDGGGGDNNPGDPNVNPTTGATVTPFTSEVAAAVHGLTWIPAEKAFYAALPTSNVGFGFPEGPKTIGKVVRVNADGTVVGIFAGSETSGQPFSVGYNPVSNKVLAVGTQQIIALEPTGNTVQATAPVYTSQYTGLESDDAGTVPTPISGLNDIIVKKDGTAYATAPYYPADVPDGSFMRVYYIKADGSAASVAHYENKERPNGIALSPDEKTLYVALTTPNVPRPAPGLPVYGEFPAIWKYTVNADGSLSGGAKFVQVGTTKSGENLTKPDGLAVDTAGNVYVATVGGVEVFKAGGESWGTIAVPEQAASLAWGGDDMKTLYIGASNDPTAEGNPNIYKVTLPVKGVAR